MKEGCLGAGWGCECFGVVDLRHYSHLISSHLGASPRTVELSWREHAGTLILLKSLISYLTLLIINIIIVIFKQLGLADSKDVDNSVILAA